MAENERSVVAFLGPEGSYTHQATLDAFKSSRFTIAPQTTIEDVFGAVQSGEAYRGVVPFENSSNGSVVFTLDLFADVQGKYPGIIVCGESYVAVKHCLLGYAPSSSTSQEAQAQDPETPVATPLYDISKIKTLYSHPQAWGQCKEFLGTYLKHAERRDVSSTSKAAEIAAQDKTGESAALSSVIAADMFGLDVLAKTINDKVENTTRFLVLRRASSEAPSTLNQQESGQEDVQGHDWKSLVTFTVDHANPGALAQCLTVFSNHGLNLTAINTRPSGVQNWNYIFFVEFKGRKDADKDDCAVNKALGELEKLCRGYRWLGSWENRLIEG
ncbi:PDT-domain-containing protein [Clathrospora elynae]|uniref:prephenate dehydratase n=1 Tax=Clathrospora elynae TaxID=706981 RepID=A0A6A5T4M7_9PLEO|nr:PDT-domain-containing protein [Clathrospora elynae]